MIPPDETMCRRILRRKIGTDHLPRLALVRRLEDDVAAVVDRLFFERIDHERRRPVAAVLEERRLGVERVNPRRHRSRATDVRVVARHFVAVARRPDDVRIARQRQREAGFASADPALPLRRRAAASATATAARLHACVRRSKRARVRRRTRWRRRRPASRARRPLRPPHQRRRRTTARARTAARAATSTSAPATARTGAARRHGAPRDIARHVRDRHRRVRRPAHRAVVLTVAVDPVRHPVVGADVIHLPDRQRHALAARRARNPRAAVVGQHEAAAVLRIDPDVVAVAAAAATASAAAKRDAAVARSMEAAVQDEQVIRILRIDLHADVVARAADERAIPADGLPRRAAVFRSPQRALIRGLNQRVHPLRIRRRDRDVDLADRRARHAGRRLSSTSCRRRA